MGDAESEALVFACYGSKWRTPSNWLEKLRAAKGFSSSELPPPLPPKSSSCCFAPLDSETLTTTTNNTITTACCSSSNGLLLLQEVGRSDGINNNNNNNNNNNSNSRNKKQDGDTDLRKYSRKVTVSAKHGGNRYGQIRSVKGSSTTNKEEEVEEEEEEEEEDSMRNSRDKSTAWTNLFADLFAMDESIDRLQLKRHKRKQERPRLCQSISISDPPQTPPVILDAKIELGSDVLSIESEEEEAEEEDDEQEQGAENLNLHRDNVCKPHSNAEESEESKESEEAEEEAEEEEEEEEEEAEEECQPHSHKRTKNEAPPVAVINDIFVIDTSLEGWRAEKVLVRMGKHWEIHDKDYKPDPTTQNQEIIPKKNTTSRQPPKRKSIKSSPVDHSSRSEEGSCSSQVLLTKRKGKRNSHLDWSSASASAQIRKQARLQKTMPQSQTRPCQKRRVRSTMIDDTHSEDNPATESSVARITPDDHPSAQPKETLLFSIYQVFLQAGKAGLTARETVSKILEQGLPGLHEGGVVPRVEVLKLISNSPYFMLLEESRYVLCSALVEEENLQHREESIERGEKEEDEGNDELLSIKGGVSHYWAAVRRARTGNTRRKSSVSGLRILNPPQQSHSSIRGTTNEAASPLGVPRKLQLKSMQQEIAGLGNRCNRSDGKGWHCPLRAKVGYLLCDHHLNRLRFKSKMVSTQNPSSVGKMRLQRDSWTIKKPAPKRNSLCDEAKGHYHLSKSFARSPLSNP